MSRHRSLIIVLALFCIGMWNEPCAADGPATTRSLVPPPGVPPTNPAPEEIPAEETPRRPLGMLLEQSPLGHALDGARIKAFGYIQGSYNYNFSNAPRAGAFRENADRLFDFEDNVIRINQLNMAIERQVDVATGKSDVGFRVEGIFGTDSRLIHADGLDFYGHNGRSAAAPSVAEDNYRFQLYPEYQFDLYQAYVDFAAPVGNGLRVRIGKFASFFGGTVDPNGNSFYSHTISFAADHPFTFTGVMLTYPFSDSLVVDGGISRGWDQSLNDNNGAIDGFARIGWLVNDHTGVTFAAVSGPEAPGNNSNYRSLLELTVKYSASDRLRFILDATYGWEPHVTPEFGVIEPNSGSAFPVTFTRNTRW